MLRISSLEELKQWNKNPTEEIPIILDWFMDYFFTKLIVKRKFKKVSEAMLELTKATMVCEKMTWEEAMERVNETITYYSCYSQSWADGLLAYVHEEYFREDCK